MMKYCKSFLIPIAISLFMACQQVDVSNAPFKEPNQDTVINKEQVFYLSTQDIHQGQYPLYTRDRVWHGQLLVENNCLVIKMDTDDQYTGKHIPLLPKNYQPIFDGKKLVAVLDTEHGKQFLIGSTIHIHGVLDIQNDWITFSKPIPKHCPSSVIVTGRWD